MVRDWFDSFRKNLSREFLRFPQKSFRATSYWFLCNWFSFFCRKNCVWFSPLAFKIFEVHLREIYSTQSVTLFYLHIHRIRTVSSANYLLHRDKHNLWREWEKDFIAVQQCLEFPLSKSSFGKKNTFQREIFSKLLKDKEWFHTLCNFLNKLADWKFRLCCVVWSRRSSIYY